MMKSLMTALAAMVAVSCQSVSSQHVNYGAGQVVHGLQYSAPKALMKVDLVAFQNALTLNLSQPFLIGDPEATYALSTTTSPFADTKYVFLVNPQTRLLTYVNAVSEGKAGEVLKKLAESIAAVKGATVKPGDEASTFSLDPTVQTTIFSTVIDPMKGCEFGKPCVMNDLNAQLRARAMVVLGCAAETTDKITAAEKSRGVGQSCQSLRDSPGYFNISLTPMFEVTGNAKTSPGDCASSICYRAPAPYLIGAHIGAITDDARVIMLPNKAPVLALDLPAGVFASAKARVDLVQGMPATVVIDKKSEALEVVAIPLNVINSFFTSFSSVVRLRVNYDNSRNDVVDSTIKREDKEAVYAARKKAAQDKLAAAEKALQETQAMDVKTDFANDPEAKQTAVAEKQATVTDAKDALKEVEDAGVDGAAGDSKSGDGGDEAKTFATLIDEIPDATPTDAQTLKAAQMAPVSTITFADGQNLISLSNVVCPDAGCPKADKPKGAGGNGGGVPEEPKEDADKANKATGGNH